MSNADPKLRRRWAREAGIPWAIYTGKRRRPKPPEPVSFTVVEEKRPVVRRSWFARLRSFLARLFRRA